MDMGGGALLHPPESLRGHERHDPLQHQHHHEHEHDQEDDLGPETSVDDGELQRQQLADLDPAAEPRQEAPTPPAASLLPGQCEPDNVADSGEESEDEWNYYKIEPTEKAVNVESLVQTKQPVCPESIQLNLEGKSEDILDMESRLNPDAKEFIPSPTHTKPSFDDSIISQSPVGKILPFDNVEVPSMAQFQQEISQRPGEVSQEDALSNSGYSPDRHSDMLNGVNIIDDDMIKKKYGDTAFQLTEQNLAAFTGSNPFEISEVSSTKAVYGDESVASFMTSTSDILQKNLGTSTSNVEGSFTETDFVASETSGVLGFEGSSEFTEFKKGLDKSLPTGFSPSKESGTISFELQKDIAPTMEESPERVKLADDLINPFSHEQPIKEMPMEECEQLPENERTALLNESFEHGPNFTLDEYELGSHLDPCAPSFNYKNVDSRDEPKIGKTEDVEALEQKLVDASLDLASGVSVSQTISPESPKELLDMTERELTELDRDTLSSEAEKVSLPEVGSRLNEISSFEQEEGYPNESNSNEKSEKEQLLQDSDEMLNFDQPSLEFVEKPESLEKSATLVDEINEKETNLMLNKEFMDELNETAKELMNEVSSKPTGLIESFDTKCEILQSSNLESLEELRKDAFEPVEELRKDAFEPVEELRKDVVEPADVNELLGDGVQHLDQLHREVDDLGDVIVSGDRKAKYLETSTDLTDVHHIHTQSFIRDAAQSLELNNEIHTEQSVVLENKVSFETASVPAEANQEPAPSAEQVMDNICTPDLHSVPEALRVCVYPMPVEQSKMKDDVELISPSLESREEKREPLEEEHIHGTDFDMAKLESLSGEQRDMVATMLNEVSNKTELEELNDLSSNAVNGVVISEELQSRLNYVGNEAESGEKTEETVEKTVEKKDISTVEQMAEKLKGIEIKPIGDETLKLSDVDFSDVKTFSGTAVNEKGESEKEVHKTGDGEDVPVITKTPPPTPTPASQVEVTADSDASEVKGESAAVAAVTAVAVAAAATAVATAGITKTTKKEPALKKLTPLNKEVKKTPIAKDSDKTKPGTKAPIKQSPGTAKVPTKTSPTSPTKPSVPSTPRTSTPKRPQVAPPSQATKTMTKTTTTAAKPLSRPTSAVASKPTSLASPKQSTGKVPTSGIAPKPGLKAALPSTTKPSQTVRAVSAPKPRVQSSTTTTATKNTLANGDVKSAEVKKTSVATSKIAPRSHTAPSRTTTAPKTAGTTAAASVPKTGVPARTSRTGMTNGIGQKPRVTSSTAPSTRPATNHQTATDKQHKETANKQISSRRIGTAPSKTSPAKVGVKKSPPTAKGGKTPPTANGSPLISTGAGDEKKKDPLL